jgi:hypothetical protein
VSRFRINPEQLTKLWLRNLTPLEIATRMNCTASGVLQAAKRLGLKDLKLIEKRST